MHPSVEAEPDSRGGDAERARPLALVADDEDDVRALVALRVETLGYEVVVARDGLEALERAAERPPDLVIVDNWMPRMDGIGVIRRLRAEERTRETPIILLTALVAEADIERGFEAGASMFCRKPFSPRELSGLVERARAEQALRERERGERERAAEEAALRRVATAVAACCRTPGSRRTGLRADALLRDIPRLAVPFPMPISFSSSLLGALWASAARPRAWQRNAVHGRQVPRRHPDRVVEPVRPGVPGDHGRA